MVRFLSFFVAVIFIASSVFPSIALASQLPLPAPTQFVPLSENYSFPVLKGLKFDQSNPFHIEFIIDTANQNKVTEEEASRLIRYFLAGLTMPEKDIWVNLSPYEKDRIINDNLGQTDLGRDLLSQDYILKQLSSSLTYPESDTGKNYWTQIYSKVAQIAHTTKLPINTFNKVWIMPDKAQVYENKDIILVSEAKLKVMLEEDYLALSKSKAKAEVKVEKFKSKISDALIDEINKAASGVMRDFLLPKISEEVNSGKNFATLRQIHYALILAVWFKQKFKDSVYNSYINKAKIKGIDLNDKNAKDKVYNLYVEAFQKGIYNYIKKDTEPITNKTIKRQYISGGYTLGTGADILNTTTSFALTTETMSRVNFEGPAVIADTKAWGTTAVNRMRTELGHKAANAEDSQVAASPVKEGKYTEGSLVKPTISLTDENSLANLKTGKVGSLITPSISGIERAIGNGSDSGNSAVYTNLFDMKAEETIRIPEYSGMPAFIFRKESAHADGGQHYTFKALGGGGNLAQGIDFYLTRDNIVTRVNLLINSNRVIDLGVQETKELMKVLALGYTKSMKRIECRLPKNLLDRLFPDSETRIVKDNLFGYTLGFVSEFSSSPVQSRDQNRIRKLKSQIAGWKGDVVNLQRELYDNASTLNRLNRHIKKSDPFFAVSSAERAFLEATIGVRDTWLTEKKVLETRQENIGEKIQQISGWIDQATKEIGGGSDLGPTAASPVTIGRLDHGALSFELEVPKNVMDMSQEIVVYPIGNDVDRSDIIRIGVGEFEKEIRWLIGRYYLYVLGGKDGRSLSYMGTAHDKLYDERKHFHPEIDITTYEKNRFALSAGVKVTFKLKNPKLSYEIRVEKRASLANPESNGRIKEYSGDSDPGPTAASPVKTDFSDRLKEYKKQDLEKGIKDPRIVALEGLLTLIQRNKDIRFVDLLRIRDIFEKVARESDSATVSDFAYISWNGIYGKSILEIRNKLSGSVTSRADIEELFPEYRKEMFDGSLGISKRLYAMQAMLDMVLASYEHMELSRLFEISNMFYALMDETEPEAVSSKARSCLTKLKKLKIASSPVALTQDQQKIVLMLYKMLNDFRGEDGIENYVSEKYPNELRELRALDDALLEWARGYYKDLYIYTTPITSESKGILNSKSRSKYYEDASKFLDSLVEKSMETRKGEIEEKTISSPVTAFDLVAKLWPGKESLSDSEQIKVLPVSSDSGQKSSSPMPIKTDSFPVRFAVVSSPLISSNSVDSELSMSSPSIPSEVKNGGIDMNGISVKTSLGSSPVIMPLFDLKDIEGLAFRIVKLVEVKDISLALNLPRTGVSAPKGEETLLAMAK